MSENLLDCVGPGADAVGDADAAVAVAGECETGQLLAQTLDAVEAFQVADAVLGHGGLPSIDAGEQGRGAEAEDLLQFVADCGDDGVIGELPDVVGVGAREEAAQQGAVVGGAMGEFVVNEGRGQQPLAFAAGYQKAEAGWERLAYVAVVAQADGDGRAVADGGKFGGKSGAADREQLCGGMSWHGENNGVEVIGFQSCRYRPTSRFGLNGLHSNMGD